MQNYTGDDFLGVMEGNELVIEADRIYGDEDLDNGDDTYDLIDNMPNQADTDWGYGSLPDVDTAEKKAFRQQYFNEQEHKRLEKENPFAYRMMSGAVMTLLTLLIVGIIGNAVSFGAAYSGAGAVATGTGSAGGGAAAKIVHELAKDGDVTNEVQQISDTVQKISNNNILDTLERTHILLDLIDNGKIFGASRLIQEMIKTEAGCQEVINIHIVVSQMILYASSAEAANSLKALQDLTRTF